MMIKCPKCDARLDGDTLVIADGWIDVRDKLPELYESVIVCLDDGDVCESSLGEGAHVIVGNKLVYDEDARHWDMEECCLALERVTHWMPMPEPPERSGGE